MKPITDRDRFCGLAVRPLHRQQGGPEFNGRPLKKISVLSWYAETETIIDLTNEKFQQLREIEWMLSWSLNALILVWCLTMLM